MKNLWLFIIFIAVLVLMSFLADRKKKVKVLFFGDSITKEGIEPAGYISIMKEMLRTQGIKNYELAGAGVSGNKVSDLFARMDEDVLAKSPDVVVIFAGVNDVLNKKLFDEAVPAHKFETVYRSMINRLHAANIKVIVCTPALIGEKKNGGNELDDEMDAYCDIIRNIAMLMRLPVIDCRKAFCEYETGNNASNAESGLLTTDGVHLSERGNIFAAELMWNTIKDMQ